MSLSSKIITLNSKTAGKDKIYRTVQYGCKLIWYILWKYKTNKEYTEVIKIPFIKKTFCNHASKHNQGLKLSILKKIESTMSGVRRVMRLGKSHDHIELILNSKQIDDTILRQIITLCNLNQSLYLILDNLIWLNSMGVLNLKNHQAQLNSMSNKFWLLSSIMYLMRDVYDLTKVVQTELVKCNTRQDKYTLNEHGAYTPSVFHSTSSLSTKKILLKLIFLAKLICSNKRYHPLLLDTIKNLFDIFLPLSNLDYVKLSPGLQGLCGLISSLISILVIWDSNFKLIP